MFEREGFDQLMERRAVSIRWPVSRARDTARMRTDAQCGIFKSTQRQAKRYALHYFGRATQKIETILVVVHDKTLKSRAAIKDFLQT